ncbi:Carboxy-cis/cis-muconate cyclase [Venturia nashicola]|nr:Carboxy-cis/cis-muconate cyclase [Venturia nashicola]
MYSLSALAVAVFATPALTATHSFFAGSFGGSIIHGLEFDDTSFSLTLVKNITINTTSGSKWIHMDSRKKNLYVAATGAFQSYAISSDLNLTYQSNVSTSTGCGNPNFITSATMGPYEVFGTSFNISCATQVLSVDEGGKLVSQVTNVTYDGSAAVHGSDLSPDNQFFYSADDDGNGVWTHSYDSATGEVTQLQHLKAANGSDPRHLTVHPNGNWVYVVYEASSKVAVYARNTSTGLLTFNNETYSLLPAGYTNATKSYWADEVRISGTSTNCTNGTSPKYLLASTRSRTVGITGYVSAFSLDATTGAITEQLFLTPTTDSGGSANAVEPAAFSEQFFAITDSGSNFIEVWEIVDGANGTSASAVAHLGLEGTPANVKWYN